MRGDLPVWLVISVPVLGGAFLFFLWKWFSEYRFYRKNGWNFEIANPTGLLLFYGPMWPAPGKTGMPNRARLVYGYPTLVIVTGALLLSSFYCIYKIETCKSDDLGKCGIHLDYGRVTIKS